MYTNTTQYNIIQQNQKQHTPWYQHNNKFNSYTIDKKEALT